MGRCKNKFSKKCLAVEEIKKMIGKKILWSCQLRCLLLLQRTNLLHVLKRCLPRRMRSTRSAPKYSEEEKAELKQLGMKISGFKCFQKEFGNSCKNLVRDQIYNFYKQKMEGGTTTA